MIPLARVFVSVDNVFVSELLIVQIAHESIYNYNSTDMRVV